MAQMDLGLVRLGTNENILDNWYFADPINQRNIVTCGSAQYGIDRWIAGGGTYTVENGYLNTIGACVLTQVIENIAQLDGKILTASALLLDGTLKTGTNKLDLSGTTLFINNPDEQFYIMKDGLFQFYNVLGMQVVAAKLELGDHQTLARQDASGNWVLNDPPPNKALELAKCQRYFQVFSSESSRPTNLMDYRPSMRTNPTFGTIEINGTVYYTADANL